MISPDSKGEQKATLVCEETTVNGHQFKFEPPLFIQRYDFVCDLLNKYECASYMDIGCNDTKLIRYVKNTNENLNLIVGLDLDEDILNDSKEKISGILFDFIHNRKEPLDLHLIKGIINVFF